MACRERSRIPVDCLAADVDQELPALHLVNPTPRQNGNSSPTSVTASSRDEVTSSSEGGYVPPGVRTSLG